jgi:hypothetical protein
LPLDKVKRNLHFPHIFEIDSQLEKLIERPK